MIFTNSLARFVLFSLLPIVFFSGNAWGQFYSQPDVEFSPDQHKLEWTPGEQYNAINGTMNYRHTDLYLPGNGNLPIEITRYFDQRAESTSNVDLVPSGNFGQFTLDLPRMAIYTQHNRYKPSLCRPEGGFDSAVRLTRQVVFRIDGKSKVFRSAGDVLITKDGWKAECVTNDPKEIEGPPTIGAPSRWTGNIKINRPDGVIYDMRLSAFNPGGQGRSTTSTYSIHKVTDTYGNTLTYLYDVYVYVDFRSVNRLKAIVANDGREVAFSYRSDDVERYIANLHNGNYVNFSYIHISKIETNSSENPIVLQYGYSDNFNTIKVYENESQVTTVETSGFAVNRITYPTGGSVSYKYGDILTTAGSRYKTLQSRTTSIGATYEFSHTDLGSSFIRHIKTPSAWLDYTYGDPKRPNSFGQILGHDINSGRLISFSRSQGNAFGSQGKRLFSVDYEYVNLDDWTHDQLAQVVRPEITTTKMNFDASGQARSVFTTENVSFDEWGYPYKVIERSTLGNEITSIYAYESDKYEFIQAHSEAVIGKIRSIFRPGDIQRFTYNTQGDIASHTDNGITTTYEWRIFGIGTGEMQLQRTAMGHTTHFSHHKRGQAQFIANPNQYSQQRVINDNGTIASETRFTRNLLFSTSERGTRYEYDSRRRLKKVVPERSLSSNTLSNWPSNTVRHALDGRENRYEIIEIFDSFGKIRAKNRLDKDQSRWSTVVYTYDSEGRLRFTSYPVNQPYLRENAIPPALPGTHYKYDALNRLIQVKQDEEDGNDTVFNYTYDAEDSQNLNIKETDGRGSVKTTFYDSYGTPHYQWPIRIVEADNQSFHINRIAGTGLVSSVLGGNQYTSYQYNSRNQLSSFTQRENGTTSMTYDADGRLKSRTNNGRAVEYVYYPDGLIFQEIYTDSDKEDVTREYRYDNHQNLEYAFTTSPSGSQNNTLFYTYDKDNNIESMVLAVDNRNYQLQFEYHELSNLKQITYPNGRTYSLNPNSFGNPTSIQQIGGFGKSLYEQIEYNPNQSMNLMKRDGHQITNELNRGLRPFKFRVMENGDGSSPLGERMYRYDRAANVSKINDTVADRYRVLSYDSRNRLISENISNADSWSFGYLPDNNIDWIQHGSIRSTYEYDTASQRLLAIKTGDIERVYGYDAHGNMSAHERLQGDDKVTRLLRRNAANQLIALSDGTSYSYDARGLRVKQDKNGAIYTLYGPDERLMFRYDDMVNVSSEYFYINEKLVARRDTDISDIQIEPPDDDTLLEPPDDDTLIEPPGDDTQIEPPNDDDSGITVDGLTISWPDDGGWYQVQNEDSSVSICEGGRSCTVPSKGNYKVINLSEDVKYYITVE